MRGPMWDVENELRCSLLQWFIHWFISWSPGSWLLTYSCSILYLPKKKSYICFFLYIFDIFGPKSYAPNPIGGKGTTMVSWASRFLLAVGSFALAFCSAVNRHVIIAYTLIKVCQKFNLITAWIHDSTNFLVLFPTF